MRTLFESFFKEIN